MKYIVEYLDENEARRTKEVELDRTPKSDIELEAVVRRKLRPKARMIRSIKAV